MKHIPSKHALIIALSLIGTPALANISISVDSENACENDIKLPAGYYFTELTADCVHNENLAPVSDGKQFGFANNKGDIIIRPQFEVAYGFDEGLALVKQNGKYGYISPNGKFAIKPQFDDAWGFWEGRAKILVAGKAGFIDKAGKVVIAPHFDETGNWFEDGLVSAKKGNKWGFIDKAGKTKIAFSHDYAEDFSEGYAVIGKASKDKDEYGEPLFKYGYINNKGKITIAPKYNYASAFSEGVASVIGDDEMYYLIDYQGNVVDDGANQSAQ